MKIKILLLFCAVAALVGISMAINRMENPQPIKPIDIDKPIKASGEGIKATLEPGRIVVVKTSRGTFIFALYEHDMPITCKNFVDLVKKGFYKNLKFHRVENWVVQTGDPKGDGTGGSDKTIKLETRTGLDYRQPFMVGMARTDDPDSATSQFFVTKIPSPDLNGKYAAFGQVFEGQEVVDKIKKDDKMESITLVPPRSSDLIRLMRIQKERPSSPTGLPKPKPDNNDETGFR